MLTVNSVVASVPALKIAVLPEIQAAGVPVPSARSPQNRSVPQIPIGVVPAPGVVPLLSQKRSAARSPGATRPKTHASKAALSTVAWRRVEVGVDGTEALQTTEAEFITSVVSGALHTIPALLVRES